MPELKRLFLKGRMNKDLDERLVPNGEYRDALNIQIGSSEGSDIGAIENILGNQVAKLKKAFPATYWELDSETTNYYGLPLDAECIGAIKDDINDRIFWFITSSTVDCIAEYTNKYGVVRPVLVDTQGVLNFSKNKLITGINLINNYLFFTDDNSEPKKVDVGSGKFGTSSFTVHSQYKGRDFIESDITVIKKSPLRAPSFILKDSTRDGNILTTSYFNFAEYNLGVKPSGTGAILNSVGVDWEYSGTYQPLIATGTIPLNTSINIDFLAGDLLVFTAPAPSTHIGFDSYRIVIEVISFVGFSSVAGIVKEIPETIVDDDLLWEVTLLETEETIFEKKLPRFGYRWKYDDNQYSCFSPFTEVAFLPGLYKYNSQDGYHTGMTNRTRFVNLEITEAAPVDVKEIEILYKETNNPTIYVVEKFDPQNFPLLQSFSDISSNNPFYYTITNDLIYRVVESNQLLRPWDNVPRLAKAQEIVGNRLVYGNYLQNYSWGNTLLSFLNLSYESTAVDTGSFGVESVKTMRTYQVGVVFKDQYGRETPVFTSSDLQVTIPISSSGNTNTLKIQRGQTPSGVAPYVPPPAWATHFKYFVKTSENDYYNLSVDRLYLSEDRPGGWLSFPSSERNKVQEDDYLILKKGVNSQDPVITKNKYKILDIKNEAPEEIKKEKKEVYTEQIDFSNSFTGTPQNLVTPVDGFSPIVGGNTIVIWDSSGLLSLKQALDNDENKNERYLRFTDNNVRATGYYKIASVNYSSTADNPPLAQIRISESFGDDVNFLYQNGTLVHDFLEIYDYVDVKDRTSQFDGRFFVKINTDDILKKNVVIADSDYLVYNNINVRSDKAGGIWMMGAGVPFGAQNDPHNTTGDNGGYLTPNNGPNPPANIIQQNWSIILQRQINQPYNTEFWNEIQSVGTTLNFTNARFWNDPLNTSGDDKVYRVREAIIWTYSIGSVEYERIYIKIQDVTLLTSETASGFYSVVNPQFIALNPLVFQETGVYTIGINLVKSLGNYQSRSTNPAVFETEPKKQADLDIYYEASDALQTDLVLTGWGATHSLRFKNCFSFGNGVESNRIRDDFNGPFIDNGTKASTILEEPYEEEARATGLIYSGIFNSNSGLNNLNQFVQAEKITKDLNPLYGSIQKLHTRDTNLVALCEDKILRILANKDALFNADGNANLTSTNNVLGQAVPFVGEFGISKNPESFASYGYRAYFSDKKRGVVLRLSMDGLTEISNKGMSDYFWENLKAATTVLGSYDIYSDCYNLTLNNNTVSFKESSDGWPTRKSFIPEWGISLNSDYYTMSNGMLWTHDNEQRNTFYEGATEKSSVQLIFNDNPNKIKNFKTISYEGDNGWTVPLIQTDQQDGAVTTFLDKENIYYNYIRGLNDTWGNFSQSGTLDLKQFAAQGIGNPTIIRNANNDGPYTGNSTFTVTVKNDPNN